MAHPHAAPPASSSSNGRAAPAPVKLTLFFRWMVLFVVLSAFNYGYGISELNALQGPLTCYGRGAVRGEAAPANERDCLGMTEAQFGYVTAALTVGGLLSSLGFSSLADRFHIGPRRWIMLSALLNAAGGAIIALAQGLLAAGAGRFVMGLGAGIAVVCVPIYLR